MNPIINFQMLKHPMNWVTVILMVVIAMIAFSMFLSWAQTPPTQKAQ